VEYLKVNIRQHNTFFKASGTLLTL